MKKLNLKYAIALSAVLIVTAGILQAQKDYTPLASEDGIEIAYKWKPSKFLKKDSPRILNLMLRNTNDYPADVSFTVDYFWKGIRKASSDTNRICIKANRTAKGKIKNLTFDRAGLSDEDLSSENFSLDVTGIAVEKVVKCKRKNRFRSYLKSSSQSS